MSPLSRMANFILVLHGLGNLSQGIYTVASPRGYAALTGDLFAGAPDKALQAIGMGAIGIGLYETIFAYQGNRQLIFATLPMRIAFAGVMASWGVGTAVLYDGIVAVVCGVALLA
ncbi:hypothetical protein FB567DRAFT_594582 [Paraphoma chrysanthemicola]|uniref:Uncharacterized protein n=1 Tax=Paraphoma chrysanthemicola TaxID=798071 RepID=A0A8K0VWR7_9PLEO|nr:hypothetical protein FB567DRAFT_594582 [Paraphoma chrysanthemicola]